MQIHFCKNHPEKIARYRCYYCKSPICGECRKTLHHHYFCSLSCYLKYRAGNTLHWIKKRKQKLFALSQLILLLLLIAQFFYFRGKLAEIPRHPNRREMPDTSHISALSQFFGKNSRTAELQIRPTGELAGREYRLTLPLEKDWVVNVWKNGRPVLTRMCTRKGVFTFPISLNYGENHLRILILNSLSEPVYRDEIRLDYRDRQVELFRHSVRQGDPQQKTIAFTFDGGSDDAHTREILQTLREQNVRCTLFLTGKFMEQHPDLVKQMLRDGHEIGNHTYSHPHLTTYADNRRQETRPEVTFRFLKRQLTRTDSIFHLITGEHLKPYWRAPYGEFNPQILTWAAQIGYLHIHWTRGFDTYDWVTDASSRLYRTPQQIFSNIMNQEKQRRTGLNGIIVLMHLGSHRNNNHIFEILPELIRAVRKKGYSIGTISELLAS